MVFRKGCLQGEIPNRALGDYLIAIRNVDNDERYLGIAENLGLAYLHAKENNDIEFQRSIVGECHLFLEELIDTDAIPTIYARCVDELVADEIPLPPAQLQENIQHLITGYATGLDQYNHALPEEVGPPDMVMSRVARLYMNHCTFGSSDQLEELDNITKQVAQKYEQSENEDPGHFMLNIYSMGLSNLVENYLCNDSFDAWFNSIEQRAITAADSDTHNLVSGNFLVNVYANALANLAYLHPASETINEWVDTIVSHATTTSAIDVHTADTTVFLIEFYSLALSKLSVMNSDPEAINDWFDTIEQQAINTATTNDNVDDSGLFLETVYGYALAYLSLNFFQHQASPETVSEWIDTIEKQSITMADSDIHNFTHEEFLSNFYSLAFSKLVDIYLPPEAVSDWIENYLQRILSVATSKAHSEYPERFAPITVANILLRISKKPSPIEKIWYSLIMERVITMFEMEMLPRFCQEHQAKLSHAGHHIPNTHVRLVETVLSRAVQSDDLQWSSQENRVTRLSIVLAASIHLLWQETGLDDLYFDQIIEAVESIENEDPVLYERLIEEVPDILDEAHVNPIAAFDWKQTFQ